MTEISAEDQGLIGDAKPSTRVVRWKRHRGFVISLTLISFIVLMAMVGPLVCKDPYIQDLGARLLPPLWLDGSWNHPLGTDALGRDYLARIVHGARISLFIGIAAAFLSGIIGTLLGLFGGYLGGRADDVVRFLISARLAMPVILVALAVVALVGSSLLIVVAVLGLLLWDRYALVVRATTQQIRSTDYITAAAVQGASTSQILRYEVLPNLADNILIVGTLEVANAIVLEAALSFLGLGVPPPLPSWGLMIAEGKSYILFDSWMVTIPGVMLFVLVLAINLLGDGLRDLTAPVARN
jgi:peptide/nickel transport system permease protein